jgi:D-alanine-D-alanine ligase
MKITILTDIEPDTPYDDVVTQVAKALRKSGHRVSILGVYDDIKKIVTGVKRRQPDLIFNLLEAFGDNIHADVGIAGLLELLEIPYTGSGPGELFLQQDKSITKKILAFQGISFPDFAVFSPDASMEMRGNLRMPQIVKPLRSDASLGIDGNALVRNAGEMMDQIGMIHKKFHDAALVEEYIEGREFYVGVIGNGTLQAFPPIEMDFSGLPEGAPRVLDSKAKWSERSAQFKGTKAIVADIPEELTAKLQKVSVEAFRALNIRDYGRVDLRLTDTGEIYVIEVNANCYLEENSEFVAGAAASGIKFQELIETIVTLAAARFKPPAISTV